MEGRLVSEDLRTEKNAWMRADHGWNVLTVEKCLAWADGGAHQRSMRQSVVPCWS